jgi:hypothetical protein
MPSDPSELISGGPELRWIIRLLYTKSNNVDDRTEDTLAACINCVLRCVNPLKEDFSSGESPG